MLRVRPWPLLVVLLAVPALAGCFGGKEPANPTPTTGTAPATSLPPGYVDPFLLNHDHANAKLHNLAYHMALTSHHPLGGSQLKSSGAHALDVRNGWLFVATYGAAADVDGGVYIFNLSNPEKPTLAGQLRMPGNIGGDRSMEATPDGNWILLGTESQDCAGHVNPFGPGLYLIDARDKTNPLIADYVPGAGTHSVVVHRIKGDDYVFALFSNPVGQNIFKIDRTLPKARLVAVGSVTISHDAAAYDDPALGIPVLYVANVNDLVVFDVSEPGTPQKLGTWSLSKEEAANHYVHAVAMQMLQGRRILVVESEDWRNLPSPVWVLDATDLGNIERIGNWTNPNQVPANGGEAGSSPVASFSGQLTFSTHNPRLENGIVYLAHYHGGVWMLDISDAAKQEHPAILGYYLPHDDNGGFVPRSSEGAYPKPNVRCGFELDQVPIVFDLEVQNGIVYAGDLHTGLYVLKRDDTVAPTPAASAE